MTTETPTTKPKYSPPIAVNLFKNILLGSVFFQILLTAVYGLLTLLVAGLLTDGKTSQEIEPISKILMVLEVPIQTLGWIVLGLLITWTYKLNKYCWSQGVQEMEIKPLMSTICWIIPLINLIYVPKTLLEISKALTLKENWKTLPSFKLIVPWWLIWIGCQVWESILEIRLEDFKKTLQDAIQAGDHGAIKAIISEVPFLLNLSAGHAALSIVTLVLLAWIILKLTAIKNQSARENPSPSNSSPPA